MGVAFHLIPFSGATAVHVLMGLPSLKVWGIEREWRVLGTADAHKKRCSLYCASGASGNDPHEVQCTSLLTQRGLPPHFGGVLYGALRDTACLPSLWPPVRVTRRRVCSGLCRRAPHPRRQSAWVSSGESLFGTSGANRGTKLAQLRGCDSAMARRGRGRGGGSSTRCFTFPTFVKGGKGGKQ